MKKLLCVVIGIAILGGIVLSTGCGGGGGGGGLLGAIAVVAFVVAVSSSGGAGAAAFAASVRDKPLPAIFSDVKVASNSIKIKVQPMKDGTAYGDATYLQSASISVNLGILTGNVPVSVEEGIKQFSVEIVAGSNTVPILKQVFSYTPTSGDTKVSSVTASSTAYAVTYTEWLKKNPADPSYSVFETNSVAQAGSLETLATTVQNQLNKYAADIATYSPTTDAVVTANAESNASYIATSTATTTEPTTTAPSNLASGSAFLTLNQGWDFTTGTPQVVIISTSQNQGKALSFFVNPGDNTYTLGNYGKFFGADDSKMILYKDSTSALSSLTSAPVYDGVSELNYRHHALVSKQVVSASATASLAQGDVYYFYVNGYYGALKITSVSNVVNFNYVYNKQSGQTSLQ